MKQFQVHGLPEVTAIPEAQKNLNLTLRLHASRHSNLRGRFKELHRVTCFLSLSPMTLQPDPFY